MTGTLFVCATPIGNLEDITLRVLRILKEVDLIAAEDTRQTVKLLNHYEIHTPLFSYHEHNKIEKTPILIEKLINGENIAIVTDAGTPAISDPGEDLVRACYENNIEVTSLPGPAAVITALTLSGMYARRFTFEGFLPVDKKEKADVLDRIENTECTSVLYEAPHRLEKTLTLLMEKLGRERKIAICRELTKKHEQALHFTLEEAVDYYNNNNPRGEFVIIIQGLDKKDVEKKERETWLSISLENHMKLYMDKGLSKKDAMKAVAKDRGISKRDVYAQLLEQEKE